MRFLTPAALAAVFLGGTLLSGPLAANEQRASFDCTKAQTPRERLTCASDEARKADADMAAAYGKWLRKLSAPQARALKDSQRQFNLYADQLCAVDRARSAEAQAEASQCLAVAMTDRAGFLGGLQGGEAGGITVEPRVRTEFRIHKADEPGDRPQGWITQDALPVLVNAPEPVVLAFAATMRRLVSPDKPLIAGRTTLVGAVTRTFTVSYMAPKLLSLQINEHVDAGTAVRDRDTGVNIDLSTGANVPLDAVFTRNAEWRRVVAEALRRDINRPEELDEWLDAIVSAGKDVIWAFGAEKVTVSWATLYPPSESVEIPLAEIARFIKPDSPWQPAMR